MKNILLIIPLFLGGILFGQTKKKPAPQKFDYKAEFKKIIWPDRKTVFKQALVVTAISVVIGVIIAVLDMVLQYGISFLTM